MYLRWYSQRPSYIILFSRPDRQPMEEVVCTVGQQVEVANLEKLATVLLPKDLRLTYNLPVLLLSQLRVGFRIAHL